jgi:ABC-2 type transport system permease protein
MMRRQLRFVAAYVRLNLASAMEYRVAFVSQVIGMILNDAIMIVFWWLFFNRFPRVGGWGLADVLRLWGVVATSFGLGTAVFGNSTRLAILIARGQLDYYLVLPKDALLHALVSRMSAPAWGDVSFGIIAFLAAGGLSPASVLLYLLLCLTGCAIFVSYHVVAGAIAFWAGNSEQLANQASAALINFSTYPGGIFRGWVKILTFTLVPAALLGHVPVDLLRRPALPATLGVTGFAALAVAVAIGVFRLGLRRYQSGNLVELRG